MENKNEKIKILIATHKPAKFPVGKYFLPIHVGRKIATELSKDGKISQEKLEWLKNNTIGDDTGDNISTKNRYYNEVTALYWAWKNYEEIGNPNYIGLMHYRRHFIFEDAYHKQKYKKESCFNRGECVIPEKYVDSKYIKRIGLIDKNIEKACKEYDAILSYKSNLSSAFQEKLTIRTDYAYKIPGMNVRDFDLMINLVKSKYPNYANAIDTYVNSDNKYMYQMFIMKKELFFEYCEFLFGILFELEKKIDFENYSINGKRTLGYLAEIMLTIFFILKQDKKLRVKNNGITFIKYDFPRDYYIKKLSNFIQSIFSIKNIDKHKVLKIIGIKIKIKIKNNKNF